jgi:hypothetical protein
MSDYGAERECQDVSLPAAIGGIPEDICSSQAFLGLTQSVCVLPSCDRLECDGNSPARPYSFSTTLASMASVPAGGLVGV